MNAFQATFTSIIAVLVSIIALFVVFINNTNDLPNMDDASRNGIHENLLANESNSLPNSSSLQPAMPGQAAFGTIQEIVTILEADPTTKWANVDIAALRQHLIDMDEVTMNSNIERSEIPGGLKMVVTGNKRTADALQRMVPTHNQMTLKSFNEWNTNVEIIDNGVVLSVTSDDTAEVDKIRGLGFIGIMVKGAEHPAHHLMMAKGGMID